MATLKLYLDTRRQNLDGTYPMKLRVTVKSQGAFIPLDFKIKKEYWDAPRQKIVKVDNRDFLNSYLRQRYVDAQNALLELVAKGHIRGKNAKQMRDAIVSMMNGGEHKQYLFLDTFNKFMAERKATSTKRSYENTLEHLKSFASTRLESLTLDDIDATWVRRFIKHMEDAELSANSQAIHLTHILAVFNEARLNELTTNNPFLRIKIKKQATRKRSLDVDKLNAVFSCEVLPKQQMYIDYFKLMFLLIGINAKDFYLLTQSNVQDGRLVYYRAKTGKLYNIKIEPEAQEIINKYRSNKGDKLLSFKQKQQDSFITQINLVIKRADKNLSSYYARHSWATIAHSIGISKDVISMALGHSFGVKITDTYIDYDAEKVDEANRKVIDWVLYGKK